MGSTEEQIGKDTKAIENSLWKGAGNPFRKKEPETERQSFPATAPRPGNKGQENPSSGSGDTDNFGGLTDEDKKCYTYVALNYDGMAYPENWASKHAITSGLSEQGLAKAANRFMQDFKKNKMSKSEVFKYPFWSAARDWDPNVIGQMGKKMSSGLESFRFDPDMVSSVKSQFK